MLESSPSHDRPADQAAGDPPEGGLLPNAPPALGGEGVIALDRAGRVLGSNQTARQILGDDLCPGEGFDLGRLFAGPSLAEVQACLDAALGGEAVEGLLAQAQDRLGQAFQCRYSLNPVHGQGNQVMGVMLNFRDEDFSPLRESGLEIEGPPALHRLGYQSLFESLAEGIFTINTRWRITSFNQAAEQITGYRRQEVLGRHCWEIFRSDLCQAGCPLRTTLESGVNRMDQDVRILDKDGTRLGVLVNCSVVRDRGGSVLGAVETFRPLSGLAGQSGESPYSQSFADIIGVSPPMRRLFELLPDLAASQASVLIQGESGTGKEMFARAIHHHSPRSNGPFVAVNCSALAETLLESELFGHEKAAFTGAVRSKVGRFELAKGGTLFLDEIGELKPELQVKLLRVLEQKVFERVGGTRIIPMDARIISATNRDLKQALKTGAFREDLYYRLRTVPLNISPLRQRRQDIPPLVQHFLGKLNARFAKDVRSLDPKVMRLLMDYAWPGNVRELERVLEHAFVFVKGPVIFLKHLPDMDEFQGGSGQEGREQSSQAPQAPPEEGERERIRAALLQAGGRRAPAALLLGLSRTSLWRRMRELGLA
ncbi:MAG: sigma 54-interacting transcriptional regulator [Desulfarculus sp.]|nr:sigma 54-interacting transcriptional regulator [Desulfarculus sp.]